MLCGRDGVGFGNTAEFAAGTEVEGRVVGRTELDLPLCERGWDGVGSGTTAAFAACVEVDGRVVVRTEVEGRVVRRTELNLPLCERGWIGARSVAGGDADVGTAGDGAGVRGEVGGATKESKAWFAAWKFAAGALII